MVNDRSFKISVRGRAHPCHGQDVHGYAVFLHPDHDGVCALTAHRHGYGRGCARTSVRGRADGDAGGHAAGCHACVDGYDHARVHGNAGGRDRVFRWS
jgi:hypothetical protein